MEIEPPLPSDNFTQAELCLTAMTLFFKKEGILELKKGNPKYLFVFAQKMDQLEQTVSSLARACHEQCSITIRLKLIEEFLHPTPKVTHPFVSDTRLNEKGKKVIIPNTKRACPCCLIREAALGFLEPLCMETIQRCSFLTEVINALKTQ